MRGKFFIFFFLSALVIFGAFIQYVQAGSIVNFVGNILAAPVLTPFVNPFQTLFALPLISDNITVLPDNPSGFLFGLAFSPWTSPLTFDSPMVMDAVKVAFLQIPCSLQDPLAQGLGYCGGGASGTSELVIIPVSPMGIGIRLCTFQISSTFYNPQMNQTYEYFLGPYSYTDENGYTYNFDSWCQTRLIDETTKQVAIYRFSIPADSSQSTLNDWFINQIQQNVGNGYTDYAGGLYHNSTADVQPIIIPYSSLCSNNICHFTDATVPKNVYVAYVAKILADYVPTSPPPPPESGGGGFLWPLEKALAQTVCPAPYLNKFFNTNNAADVLFPTNYNLGNAIIGPYRTESCAPPSTTIITPTSTPSVESAPEASQPPGSFSLNPSSNNSVSANSVMLSWTASSNAAGYRILRASSPFVDITPYQPYTALNFTDTTVNQNTSYTYQIEAYNSLGTIHSNIINVTTPYSPPTVSLSANPETVFELQSSILSWSSAYTTSCFASGNWSGSKSTSGSETVIPSPPPSATYTLTCSGPGGSAGSSITINIAALSKWQEIAPR